MTSPCADCTRGCCRDYLVTVTGYDMWVIANGLNMAPEEFVITVAQKTPNGRVFLLDPSTATGYDIALDKRRMEAEDKPCVFWIELSGGTGRCGIYQLRPYVCQTYPATFMDNTEVIRREDVLCPTDAWRDGVLQRPVWRGRVLRMYVEYEIYGLAVSRWNYHVLHTPHAERIDIPGYYAFLMSYYRRLEPVRASLSPDEWTAMCEQWCACLAQGSSPIRRSHDSMRPWASLVETIGDAASDFFPDDGRWTMDDGRSTDN